METSDWAALALWLAVLCFALQAFGVKIGSIAVSFIWLGVAFLVAGAYAIPAL